MNVELMFDYFSIYVLIKFAIVEKDSFNIFELI